MRQSGHLNLIRRLAIRPGVSFRGGLLEFSHDRLRQCTPSHRPLLQWKSAAAHYGGCKGFAEKPRMRVEAMRAVIGALACAALLASGGAGEGAEPPAWAYAVNPPGL